MKRFILTFIIFCLLGVVAYVGYLQYGANAQSASATTQLDAPNTVKVTRGTVQQSVSAPGALVGTNESMLSFPVSGRLATIPVRAGEKVKAGTVLATLETSELERSERQQYNAWLDAQLTYSQTVQGADPTTLEAAHAALISARAAYSDLIAPPTANEIAPLDATLRNAQATLTQAQNNYESSQDRSVTTLALEQAKNNLAAAQATYDALFVPPNESAVRNAQAQIASAEATLAALQPDPDTIAQAKLRLEQAYANWQQALAAIHNATLVAPDEGVILEIYSLVGANNPANQEIIHFANPAALEVQAKVIEEDLPLVQIGQAVEVYFDAVPDLLATGRVTRINPLRLPGDRPLYAVYIELDDVPPTLLAGMSSDVAIIINRKENVLQLPRAMVRSGANGIGRVEVWHNGKREKREVKVGLRGDVYAEILEGLQEGDEVVSK